MKLPRLAAAAAAITFLFTFNAHAQPKESFNDWLADMRQTAISEGISPAVVNGNLTDDLTPNQRVIDLDGKQPEGTMTFAQYRQRIVNQTRINTGRQMMARYKNELAEIEQRFGVQPQYVVALWGIETNYGSNTGGFDIIRSLASLAWDGRRRDFFTDELVHALRILEQGHIDRANLTGSWAGALGQVQFMPSSFARLAVDGDGDGKKDIWTNRMDAFASAANYLSKSGWHGDERWGREVILPRGFSQSEVTSSTRNPNERTLDQWRNMGLKQTNGAPIPVVPGMKGFIVQPDGSGGPSYLVYNNYKTILSWNRSTYFATSVGLLANAIAN